MRWHKVKREMKIFERDGDRGNQVLRDVSLSVLIDYFQA